MREIRTSGSTSGEEETELWRRLRHRHYGESRRQQLLPRPGATAPLLDSTLAREMPPLLPSTGVETILSQNIPHALRPSHAAEPA